MSTKSRTLHKQELPEWTWNVPLLVRSLCIAIAIVLLSAVTYYWQSSGMASELLVQVKNCDARGDNNEKVKWLSRYVRLVPSDVQNLAELAFAVDAQERGEKQNFELARSRLSAAIVACGYEPEFDELRGKLRRKLIPRLLQFRVRKAPEAEEQIILLGAASDDGEVIKWLAQSLMFQRVVTEYKDRDPSQVDKKSEYWKWLSAQPIGHVLQLAVEKNPDDVELAARFLSMYAQQRSLFDSTENLVSSTPTDEVAKQTIDRLLAMKENGRGQLIAYQSLALSDRAKANAVLANALEPAFARLNEFASQVTNKGEQLVVSMDYNPASDWQIALEYTGIVETAEAEKICERLIKMASDRIPANQLEGAYLRLANLKWEKNEYDGVLATCKAGLASIKQSTSLNRLIAFANIQLERAEEAKKAVSQLESLNESLLRQVDGARGLSMTTDEKSAMRQQIAGEQWMLRLLKGRIAILEYDFSEAIKLLRDAFRSTIAISSDSRVEAGKLLASCYSQTNEWDLAGQVLSECSKLRPNDRSLSMDAARAWRQAGSPDRASEQIGNQDDGSYQSALDRAILIVSKPVSQLDKPAVVAAVKTVRERFEKLSVDEQTLVDPWRLELLEIRIGEDESKTQTEREQDTLTKLEVIAEKYSDVAEVQSLAAVDFSAFGRLESANKALSRLEDLAERSKKVESRANSVLVKARVYVVRKDTEGALKVLLDAMKSIPEKALDFAKVAAQIEIRENRFDKAYEVMCLVPNEKLDFDAMVLLAGIADSLRLKNATEADQLSSKFEGWINQLKKSEGEEGTNWRYFAAERILSKIGGGSNDKQLLDEAAALASYIDASRPHWGLSSALSGKIESLRAELYGQQSASEEAIRLWRRAIRNGDNRVSTVMDLVRELRLRERPDEGDIEFQRIQGWSDSVVPVSEIAVSSAMRRGDYSEALAIAERLTTRKPEDAEGWILRAKTAFAASLAQGVDSEMQAKRRAESWSYLEEAFKRSKSISVWDSRFRFKLQSGDKDGAYAVIEDMLNEPSLSDERKSLEAARRYLVLKDFGLCRKYLDNCLLLNPRSAEVQIVFAEMYSAIGDNDEFLNSLRKAYKAAPKNQAIRERLALSIAFSKGESSENDLKEVDALLASSASTSRSTIVGAWIALRRGDKNRQLRAIEILEQLAGSDEAERLDAKRILAFHHSSKWYSGLQLPQPKLVTDSFEAAKQLYEELLSEVTINPEDAARYINLLLSAHVGEKEAGLESKDDYLAIAEQAVSQLEAATGNSVVSLQLRLRLANINGQNDEIENIVDKWIKGPGNLRTLGDQYLWEIAGMGLIDSGHSDKAIPWLEKVYESDPKKYGGLVIALVRAKNYERALSICVSAYHEDPSPVAATLIAEVAIMQTEAPPPEEASQILKESLTKFSNSAEFLDAMGTWQLMQRRLPEAVSFFEMAEKLDPKRRRTLNNLAMALSEMPMRKQDALGWIEKAIQIYGRDPDLLDTLGQVHFRNGHLKEALETLQEASSRKDDITFRLHLAQVQLAKEDLAGAKEQWKKIKQSNIENAVLTPGDKEFLAKLNTQFGDNL